MFSFECMQHKGKAIGICIERYYVGSCCNFNSSSPANELKIHNDHRLAESTGPVQAANNSLKLRMVNKPNITAYIKSQVNKLFSDSTVKRPANQPEKLSTSVQANQTSHSSSPTIPGAASEESESANFINFTGLIDSSSAKSPIKLNYFEQTKPVNLIEHQTTISSPQRVNYLSTDSASSDGSISSSASPLAEPSPVPLNNSQVDRLIDYQIPTTTEASPLNAINFINSSASTLPSESSIEKYFLNQGRHRVSLCGREPSPSLLLLCE